MMKPVFVALLFLISVSFSNALCGNYIVEAGEDCDTPTNKFCSQCRYRSDVAAAITGQYETLGGDPALQVELVTVMKYPFRPINPRLVGTPNLNITTISTSLSDTTARVCNDTYGSDCGQYWEFYWWMGNACENPSGTYTVRWDVVCRNNTSCLPFLSYNGAGIVMDNTTMTLTITYTITTTADYCGGRDIEVPVGYEMVTYNDPSFTHLASAFIQCRNIYLAINNVDGPTPDSMTVDILQISGGDFLISSGLPQYADVNITYSGANAQVAFQLSQDRFPFLPKNGAISFGVFAHLTLSYNGKRNPSSTLLTGNATVSNCAGTCIANQCHLAPPPLTTSQVAGSNTVDSASPSSTSKVNGSSTTMPSMVVLMILVGFMGAVVLL